MNRLLLLPLLAFSLSGCVNVYSRIDTAPGGRTPLPFRGIADYLSYPSARLHVIQVHGMGDHSHANDCSRGSENLALQDAIVKRLGYRADAAYTSPEPRDIVIHGFTAGTYSVRRFAGWEGQQLYFSCVTWGETSRTIKRTMLELDDQFREMNANEAHRAPLNRAGKRFVNTSFADPMIYVGGLGVYIRTVVWSGITLSIQDHATASLTAPLVQVNSASLADRALAFAGDIPTVVISDSLAVALSSTFCAIRAEEAAARRQGRRRGPLRLKPRRSQGPEPVWRLFSAPRSAAYTCWPTSCLCWNSPTCRALPREPHCRRC